MSRRPQRGFVVHVPQRWNGPVDALFAPDSPGLAALDAAFRLVGAADLFAADLVLTRGVADGRDVGLVRLCELPPGHTIGAGLGRARRRLLAAAGWVLRVQSAPARPELSTATFAILSAAVAVDVGPDAVRFELRELRP